MTQSLRFSFFSVLFVCLLSIPVSLAAQLERWSEPFQTKLQQPQDPVGVDLFETPAGPELIATDALGGIAVFGFEEGKVKELLSNSVTSGLTSPVVADFFGTNILSIAAATQDGRVLFFDSVKLEMVKSRKVSETAISVDLTVVRLPSPEDSSRKVNVVIVPDDSGIVHSVYINSNGAVAEYWPSVRTGSKVTAPISTGSPRVLGQVDLLVSLADGHIVLINAETGAFERLLARERTPVFTTILPIDLVDDERDELVFALESGSFQIRSYQGIQPQGRLDITWEFDTRVKPVGDPVLISDSNGSPNDRLIFLGTNKTLYALRPNSRDTTNWFFIEGLVSAYGGINTSLSVLPSDRGYARLAFQQEGSVALIDVQSWIVNDPASQFPSIQLSEKVEDTLVAISHGAGGGAFEMMLVGLTVKGEMQLVSTGLEPPTLTNSPWMSRGGTSSRKNLYDREYFQNDLSRRHALRSVLDSKTREMEDAIEAGEWDTALSAAEWRRDFDPFNTEYQAKFKEVRIKKNLLLIIATVVVVVTLLGLLAFIIIRAMLRGRLDKQARAAVAQDRYKDAEALYEKLHSKIPNNKRVLSTLAVVYTKTGNRTEKTIPVLEKAHAIESGNAAVLFAYAYSLFQNHKTDATAKQVYEKSLSSNFPEPGKIEYALANCYISDGQDNEAAKLLRSALTTWEDDAVYRALCDLYLRQENISDKALPVYKHCYQKRQSDPRFMELYLKTEIAANQPGAEIESLCYQVLDLNPNNVDASLFLAKQYLAHKEPGRAIDEIKRVTDFQPENQEAQKMLASCYIQEKRQDADAQRTYRSVLEFDPDNQEVLQSLVELAYYNNQFESEDIKLYHQSFKVNGDDPTTLKALAKTARLSGDHELSVKVLEPLIRSGYAENEHTVQLAQAYIELDDLSIKKEKVLRDALRIDRENLKVNSALAKILAQEKREDPESIAIYELHLKDHPTDLMVSSQLVKAYSVGQRFEDALSLALSLEQAHPTNDEVKNLVAYAKLYGNKLDDAVKGYEEIIAKDPSNRDAQVHLAEAYAQKNRKDADAAKLYERALEHKPNSGAILLALAAVHIDRNDTVKAIQNYQQYLKVAPNQEDLLILQVNEALKEHPDAIRIRWFLCEVLVGYGRLREAMEQLNMVYDAAPTQGKNILGALEKVLSKDKNNIAALATKGRIYADMGEGEKAMEMLESAFKLQPTNKDLINALKVTYERLLEKRESSETRYRLGKMYFQMEDFDNAISQFQRTVQDYRTEADSCKMLARCFMAKDIYDMAFQGLQKLVVDEEVKELLYDLAKRYESKQDIEGAKNVYRQLFAADIGYRDVKQRFEALSSPDSSISNMGGDAYERTSVMQAMSEDAKRRYELQDELGRGAMGIVYKAKDKELDEIVALKILPEQLSNNEEAVRRFKIEARNARKLSHHNIVRIHDIGEEAGRRYISMEFVDGSDLKRKVKTEGKFTLAEFFKYSIDIAGALGYAHRLGIVHRDIKPANIMLDVSDTVKITDFGIAKLLDAANDGEGTMVGAVIGTPLYMSPEQVQGIPVDNRADLYAFGIMLYEFLNSRPPFTKGDLQYQHMHEQAKRIDDCPDEVWNIITKCLEKDRENRWADAEEIVEALKEAKKKLNIS